MERSRGRIGVIGQFHASCVDQDDALDAVGAGLLELEIPDLATTRADIEQALHQQRIVPGALAMLVETTAAVAVVRAAVELAKRLVGHEHAQRTVEHRDRFAQGLHDDPRALDREPGAGFGRLSMQDLALGHEDHRTEQQQLGDQRGRDRPAGKARGLRQSGLALLEQRVFGRDDGPGDLARTEHFDALLQGAGHGVEVLVPELLQRRIEGCRGDLRAVSCSEPIRLCWSTLSRVMSCELVEQRRDACADYPRSVACFSPGGTSTSSSSTRLSSSLMLKPSSNSVSRTSAE